MRIAIIGHFGGDKIYNDGQTVKVKNLYNGLREYLPDSIRIDIVDTYYYKKKPMRLFTSFAVSVIRDKKIIFLPASRGRKILIQAMYYVAKYLNKDIYHDSIGGGLVRDVNNNPSWIRYLNSYRVNWMESSILVDGLINTGIRNAEYLPNFKNITALSTSEYYENSIYRFCTFSRVSEMKGINEAIDAIMEINARAGKTIASLDIYGPIQPGEEAWFNALMNSSPTSCKYCGTVDSSESVSVLKQYYCLLFPTRYKTEGMPGTIIDAMFSGVPVIARKWDSCDQMILDGYNGLVYDFETPERLSEKIQYAINNPENMRKMRNNCLKEAVKYSKDTIIPKIINEMGISNGYK